MRMLGVFEKSERVRHIGHLDIQRAVQRGLRRSGLPVAYSSGFNPHIQVAFASALSTGACGLREIMDVKMTESVSEDHFLEKMNKAMPPEMRLTAARALDDKHPALTSLLKAAQYEIRFRDPVQAEILLSAMDSMIAMEKIIVPRKTKSGVKDVDMKPLICTISRDGAVIRTTLVLTEQEACKSAMILEGLRRTAGIPENEEIRALVVRTQLLGETSEGSFAPLETL